MIRQEDIKERKDPLWSRLTFDFITAGKVFGDPDEAKLLEDANGVKPRFGRCWWFWFPSVRAHFGHKYLPSFSIAWLCFMLDFMLWPHDMRSGNQPKGPKS